MSIFGSVLGSIGGKIIGSVVGNTADYVYDMLPKGFQDTLSSVGNFLGIGSDDIGRAAGDVTEAVLQKPKPFDMSILPSGTQVGGSNFSSRGGFQSGQAQLMPFGRTDRVSRAMQDQRVANKLMKMAAGYRVPTPNIRMGSNITLASARTPAVSLARKYSKGTVKA